MLGKLAAHLILYCTSTDEATRDETMKALHQLFIFIASPSERSCDGLSPCRPQVPRLLTDQYCVCSSAGLSLEQKNPKKPQIWECQQTLLYQEASQENKARYIFEVRSANPEPTGEPRSAVSGRVQALSLSSPGAYRALTLCTPGVTQPCSLIPALLRHWHG